MSSPGFSSSFAIEPIVTYAAEIWGSSATRVHIKRKLISIQRLSTISIAKAYKTAPTEALLVLCNLQPVDLKIRQAYIRYNLTKLAENKITLNHLLQITSKDNYKDEIKTLGKFILDNGIGKETDPEPIHPSFAITHEVDYTCNDSTVNIYTDGSRTKVAVGCAFVVYKAQHCLYQMRRRLATHCTNNQAESLAICYALEWITKNFQDFPMHTYCIHSDSKVAIQQLIKINTSLPIVKNSLSHFKTLTKNNINISINWIKGHSGDLGNERANLLARSAPNSSGQTCYSKISTTYLKSKINSIFLEEWQARWDSADTGRLTHNFIPDINAWIKNPHHSTTFQLTQLLTGHGNLKTYLRRFLGKTDNFCKCNLNEEEDTQHIIYHCPLYTMQRRTLIEAVYNCNQHWPCTTQTFTRYSKAFFALRDFAKEIKLLD
ncbi:uncharacterized protein [Centruroides vittatus]|uniref:uncharacterized protein n=1 Tax=Centruroides vittatus TaxID=120091 RepID=UPI00351057FA